MVIFRYDVEAPFLTWAVIAADGTVARPHTPIEPVDVGYMVHDSALTERYVVLVIGPVTFDIDAMMSGGQVLKWQPELGTRIALVPRDGSDTIWIDTDAFWVWHFANAYDDGDDVVVDFPAWSAPGFLVPDQPVTGSYQQARINPTTRTVSIAELHAATSEFPRIDDRRLGAQHRYSVVTRSSGLPGFTREHDVLARIDLSTGEWVEHRVEASIGETVFAPRDGGTDELDGYYLTFATSAVDGHSALFVWDAADFPATPRARVIVPQRIPNGLHGNWFPA